MGVLLKAPISSTETFCAGLDSVIEKLHMRRIDIAEACASLDEGWEGSARDSFAAKANNKLAQLDVYIETVTRMRDFFRDAILTELKDLQEQANSFGIPFGVGPAAPVGTVLLTTNCRDESCV